MVIADADTYSKRLDRIRRQRLIFFNRKTFFLFPQKLLKKSLRKERLLVRRCESSTDASETTYKEREQNHRSAVRNSKLNALLVLTAITVLVDSNRQASRQASRHARIQTLPTQSRMSTVSVTKLCRARIVHIAKAHASKRERSE